MYKRLHKKRYQDNNIETTILKQKYIRDCIMENTKTITLQKKIYV